MKEKFKLLIPLVFVGVTVSCGQSGPNIKLNRETYADKIGTATAFALEVADIKNKQVKEVDDANCYTIPSQGTLTSHVNVNFTADKIYASYIAEEDPENEDPLQPTVLVDVTDVNETVADQVVISWDLDKNYLKVDTLNVGVNYITKDNNGKWWFCNDLLDGTKNKKDVTSAIIDDYKYFANCVFNMITYSLTYEIPVNTKYIPNRAGFDISGFIGPNPLKTNSSAELIYHKNVLSPMSLLTYEVSEGIPVSSYIDILNIALQSLGYDHCFNASKDVANNAYCEEIGTGNVNFKDLNDLYNSETVQALLALLKEQSGLSTQLNQCSGMANINFFLNYKNNFIHQEELLADFKDINFDFNYIVLPTNAAAQEIDYLDCDIQKVNLNCVANQETVYTCSAETINLADYPVVQ